MNLLRKILKIYPTSSDNIHHKIHLPNYDNNSDNESINTDKDYDEVVSRLLGDIQRRVVYPQMAYRAGIEGKVIVKVFIGKDGRPKEGKTIIVKSAIELLNNEVMNAIMHQVYPLATQYGQSIELWASIPIVFRLR
jgi:TonB family protein